MGPVFTMAAVRRSNAAEAGAEAEDVVAAITAHCVSSHSPHDGQLVEAAHHVCYIMTLGVEAQYRGRGLAARLLRMCLEFAEQNGAGAVRAWRGAAPALSAHASQS